MCTLLLCIHVITLIILNTRTYTTRSGGPLIGALCSLCVFYARVIVMTAYAHVRRAINIVTMRAIEHSTAQFQFHFTVLLCFHGHASEHGCSCVYVTHRHKSRSLYHSLCRFTCSMHSTMLMCALIREQFAYFAVCRSQIFHTFSHLFLICAIFLLLKSSAHCTSANRSESAVKIREKD
jgi:hypothetical protein